MKDGWRFWWVTVALWSGSFWTEVRKTMKDLLEGTLRCQGDRFPSPLTPPSGDTGPLGPHPSQIAARPKFPLKLVPEEHSGICHTVGL